MANNLEQHDTLRTEATLAELRQKAVDNLLLEGVRSAYSSTARNTDHGLSVQTTAGGKTVDAFVVGGSSQEHIGIAGTGLTGQFEMARAHGASSNWNVDASVSHYDALMHDSDRGTLKLQGKSGGVETSYLPAESREVAGKFDANNQPVRVSERSDGPNCQPENEFNPGNHRIECDFILQDSKLGTPLSYNETREAFGNNSVEYRSVVRDMKGNVLGIVTQDLTPTANGFNVSTSARRPDKFQGHH